MKPLVLAIFACFLVGCVIADDPALFDDVTADEVQSEATETEGAADIKDGTQELLEIHECVVHQDCREYAMQYCGTPFGFCEILTPDPRYGICDCASW